MPTSHIITEFPNCNPLFYAEAQNAAVALLGGVPYNTVRSGPPRFSAPT